MYYATLTAIQLDVPHGPAVGPEWDNFERVRVAFNNLNATARAHGFAPGGEFLPIPHVDGWRLEARQPGPDELTVFLLAVCTPYGISPIPINKPIDAPMFAVVVGPTYYGYFQEREFTETAQLDDVTRAFADFLRALG